MPADGPTEHRGTAHIRTARVMGTMASIHVHDDRPVAELDAHVDAVLAELERLEAMFSTFRPNSQLSQVNRGERTLLSCDPEVIDVLDACTWLEHASSGAFRARRPGTDVVDPAGFVKGWATERAAARLTAGGLRHWYLSVGGDLLVSGSPAPGRPWHVALADPTKSGSVVAWLEVPSGAVATSGTAERGRHLWDGRGCGTVAEPARTGIDAGGELRSVTVLGPSLTWADAFATTAFALGREGPAWVAQFDGYAAVTVDSTGHVEWTGAMAAA